VELVGLLFSAYVSMMSFPWMDVITNDFLPCFWISQIAGVFYALRVVSANGNFINADFPKQPVRQIIPEMKKPTGFGLVMVYYTIT